MDRRTRKRLATRQNISDVATRLFIERGFDNVTIDEIAEAADVGRMTVFNHFPRKEDMFFDRKGEGLAIFQQALATKEPATPPLKALYLMILRLASDDHPAIRFNADSLAFTNAIRNSDALMSSVRLMRDQFVTTVAEGIAKQLNMSEPDSDIHLGTHLLFATLSVAFVEAHKSFSQHQNSDAAKQRFVEIMTKGFSGVQSALAETDLA
ncbi:TetR/AcrR family transcriptional regulator [Saccharospirillum mangrovi]|uniref:TetR/AcrR family transcriptional regulator n=1 Tax=Saccharospirillum mangrovi TaxID=2161747 RepID=UPI0013009F73|nr:TetR/AcrR family transcriptional regulator [Saccharospirillum mangrovi]